MTIESALDELAKAIDLVHDQHYLLIDQMECADSAEDAYTIACINAFLDWDNPADPTPGAQYVAHGSNDAQRKDRRTMWLEHDATVAAARDYRDRQVAQRRRYEASLERARNLLSLAKRRVDALIAA